MTLCRFTRPLRMDPCLLRVCQVFHNLVLIPKSLSLEMLGQLLFLLLKDVAIAFEFDPADFLILYQRVIAPNAFYNSIGKPRHKGHHYSLAFLIQTRELSVIFKQYEVNNFHVIKQTIFVLVCFLEIISQIEVKVVHVALIGLAWLLWRYQIRHPLHPVDLAIAICIHYSHLSFHD